MRREYFKINLNNCYFWKKGANGELIRCQFNNPNSNLCTIYFTKIDDCSYKERYTGLIFKFENGVLVEPFGLEISERCMTACKVEDVLVSFDKLKKEDLLIQYNSILNSLSCDYELEGNGLLLKK